MTDMTVGKASPGASAGVEFYVPSKEATEKAVREFEKPQPDYMKPPENLADNDALAKKVHDVAYTHFSKYQGSSARSDLETYLKDADAKWRMARETDTQFRDNSQQKQSTLSHVSSGQFYNTVRLITAGERSILFNDPAGLPAHFKAKIKTADYTDQEGKRVAEGQQLYLQYVWGQEDLETQIKKLMLLTNKNSMSVCELAWKYECETRPERMIGWYDKDGNPVEYDREKEPPEAMYDAEGEPFGELFNEEGVPQSFVTVKKTRVAKEWPVLLRHDLKDFYCDLELKDPHLLDQTCIIIRRQMTYGELLAEQKAGRFMNVEKLTKAHLYTGEMAQNSDVESKRYDNADHSKDDLTNGLFDVFYVRMLVPKGDNGDWDDKAIPELHESVYVGNFSVMDETTQENSCVCVQLREDPYYFKKRFFVLHSHEDEKGLVRMGYYTLLECLVEELTVLKNQLIDNKTLAVKSPFVAEAGNLLSRDLYFRDGNQVIWVKPGTGGNALTKLNIPDMTQRFAEEYKLIKDEAEEIAGIVEALRGEFAGSRTTGTEYMGAREQAAKPAIEDAKQKYVPFLKWLCEGISEIGRQFGDPNRMLVVTDGKGDYMGEVNPTQLYGRLDVTVDAIDNFVADLAARQVLVNFLQAGGYERGCRSMTRYSRPTSGTWKPRQWPNPTTSTYWQTP